MQLITFISLKLLLENIDLFLTITYVQLLSEESQMWSEMSMLRLNLVWILSVEIEPPLDVKFYWCFYILVSLKIYHRYCCSCIRIMLFNSVACSSY